MASKQRLETRGSPPNALSARPFLKFNLMAKAAAHTKIQLGAQLKDFPMSNASVKIAFAFFIFLAMPTASFARMAGQAGTGNLAISGIPPGPANVGGLNNVTADPSGIGNAAKLAPLPPPHISVPAIPQFK
jgi:hypothetical protein